MICTECRAEKPVDQFYVDRSRPRGRVARCVQCYSEKQKKSRLISPHRRFAEAKGNATRRGLAWELTFEQFMAWIWGAPCYYCGDDSRNHGMDRLNNEPVYSAYTVVACCWECNAMKGDRPLNVFLTKVHAISANVG